MRKQLALLGIAAGLTASAALADQCQTNFSTCSSEVKDAEEVCVGGAVGYFAACEEFCPSTPPSAHRACTTGCSSTFHSIISGCQATAGAGAAYCLAQYASCEG